MTLPWFRSERWRHSIYLFAVAAAVSSAACRALSQPSPEPRTLRIGVQNAVEAIPVLTDLLYADPLLTIDWYGKPSLRLASGYQWPEEDKGLTLVISLRRGVQFHDGTPVTAGAVAEILRHQERTRGFRFLSSVDTDGDTTVRLHLSRPDAFLIDAIGATSIIPLDKPDVGTGPFKLLARAPVIRALRNPNYYRGVPGIEQVQVTTYDTTRRAWTAMMQGEVDMVTEVSRESVEFLRGATRFETYPFVRPYYIPLVFNVRHPILKNVEVRRALSDAIDRDEIVRSAMRGHGRVAEDPLWPLNWAYTPTTHRHSFDPAGAAARLEAAGLPVRKPPTTDLMPSRFQIRCLYWNQDPQYERVALLLQRQLATIGVDLVLEATDQKQLGTRIKAGDFDTYIYRLGSGKSFEYTYRFWHSDANGVAEVQNTGYTGVSDILERLRKTRRDAEIRVAVAELRERFYQDAPAVFIAWVEATRAIDSRFDVGDAGDPDMLANLWRWSPSKPLQRASR